MNEAGLVVEVMWLNSSKYPAVDSRPSLNELQWVQYVLDNFATVADLVEQAPKLRIAQVFAEVHYLVCDKTSACAAMEYINGRLVISTGDDMPAKTLTNNTYADSALYLKRFAGFGGSQSTPGSLDSLDRFVRASSMALDSSKSMTPEYVFSILDSVYTPGYTQWNLVYVPDEMKVYFRTSSSTNIKSVKLSDFDGACTATVKVLDIDTGAEGDTLARFSDYTTGSNKLLLEHGFGSLAAYMPAGLLDKLANYPETLTCNPTVAPPLDAGSTTADAGVAGVDAALVVGDGGAVVPSDKDEDDGGCQVASSRSAGPTPWLFAIGFVLFAASRRVRRRR
ncbi:MAG: linear amide C-N hydrolase [Deltaproteobacteria bacterium]|nr:linear amide C-N hydrolase [Deltaproteobacteria bacterium]